MQVRFAFRSIESLTGIKGSAAPSALQMRRFRTSREPVARRCTVSKWKGRIGQPSHDGAAGAPCIRFDGRCRRRSPVLPRHP